MMFEGWMDRIRVWWDQKISSAWRQVSEVGRFFVQTLGIGNEEGNDQKDKESEGLIE